MLRFSDARNFGRTLTGLALIVGPLIMLVGGIISPNTDNDNKLKELNSVAAHKSAYIIGSVLFPQPSIRTETGEGPAGGTRRAAPPLRDGRAGEGGGPALPGAGVSTGAAAPAGSGGGRVPE